MPPEIPKWVKLEDFGGKEDDVSEYVLPLEKRSCDRIHHFLRSLAHQKNHIKHLKDIIEPYLSIQK